MSKIMELRTKRNTLWEQTKAFLEKHRGENGLVEASAVETYNKMAADVQALGAEIERLEQQAAVDAALAAPTSKPVTNAPTTQPKAEGTASDVLVPVLEGVDQCGEDTCTRTSDGMSERDGSAVHVEDLVGNVQFLLHRT